MPATPAPSRLADGAGCRAAPDVASPTPSRRAARARCPGAPRRAGGRPALDCGPAPARAGRSRPRGPRPRPRSRRRRRCRCRRVTRAKRHGARAEHRAATVVLESREDGEALNALGLGHHLPHRTRSGPLHRLDVEQTHALVRLPVGSGEAPPHHLEAGAHRKHHRTARDAPGQGPVVDRGCARPEPVARPRRRRGSRCPPREAGGPRPPAAARHRRPAIRRGGPGSARFPRPRRCPAGRGRRPPRAAAPLTRVPRGDRGRPCSSR